MLAAGVAYLAYRQEFLIFHPVPLAADSLFLFRVKRNRAGCGASFFRDRYLKLVTSVDFYRRTCS
ncbi:MAG: hypothetical protein IPP88_03730 [Betaproteobacteria bacterium]|nr:hypothetical protein [Betaproteobacteria bacterium]